MRDPLSAGRDKPLAHFRVAHVASLRASADYRGNPAFRRAERRSNGAWHVDCLSACVSTAQSRDVKRIDIMETQAHDLAQHFNEGATTSSADKSRHDEDVRAEEAELEQLADRVSAARSVY